jgi:hypothetical protein
MGTYSYIGSGLSLPDAFRGCPIWLDFSWAWLSGSSELLFPDAPLHMIQHQCKGNVEHPSAYGRMLVVDDVVLLCKVEYVYAVCVSTSLMCCVLQRLPFLYAYCKMDADKHQHQSSIPLPAGSQPQDVKEQKEMQRISRSQKDKETANELCRIAAGGQRRTPTGFWLCLASSTTSVLIRHLFTGIIIVMITS